MNYGSVIDDLFEAFPNLSLEGYEDTDGLPHVVFGDIFANWVEELLLSTNRSAAENAELTRAFDFIDRMLGSGDENVENVVLLSVLGHLVAYCGLEHVQPWCGPLSASWLDHLPPG